MPRLNRFLIWQRPDFTLWGILCQWLLVLRIVLFRFITKIVLSKDILSFSFWPPVSKEKKRVLRLSRYCLCLRHFLRGTVSQSSTVLQAVGRRSMIGAWYLRTTSLTPFSIAATQRRVKTIMWITPSQCGPNFYDDEGSIAILRGVVRCFLGTVPNFS